MGEEITVSHRGEKLQHGGNRYLRDVKKVGNVS